MFINQNSLTPLVDVLNLIPSLLIIADDGSSWIWRAAQYNHLTLYTTVCSQNMPDFFNSTDFLKFYFQ